MIRTITLWNRPEMKPIHMASTKVLIASPKNKHLAFSRIPFSGPIMASSITLMVLLTTSKGCVIVVSSDMKAEFLVAISVRLS